MASLPDDSEVKILANNTSYTAADARGASPSKILESPPRISLSEPPCSELACSFRFTPSRASRSGEIAEAMGQCSTAGSLGSP